MPHRKYLAMALATSALVATPAFAGGPAGGGAANCLCQAASGLLRDGAPSSRAVSLPAMHGNRIIKGRTINANVAGSVSKAIGMTVNRSTDRRRGSAGARIGLAGTVTSAADATAGVGGARKTVGLAGRASTDHQAALSARGLGSGHGKSLAGSVNGVRGKAVNVSILNKTGPSGRALANVSALDGTGGSSGRIANISVLNKTGTTGRSAVNVAALNGSGGSAGKVANVSVLNKTGTTGRSAANVAILNGSGGSAGRIANVSALNKTGTSGNSMANVAVMNGAARGGSGGGGSGAGGGASGGPGGGGAAPPPQSGAGGGAAAPGEGGRFGRSGPSGQGTGGPPPSGYRQIDDRPAREF